VAGADDPALHDTGVGRGALFGDARDRMAQEPGSGDAHLAAGERQEAEPLLQRLDSCCPTSRLTARAHTDLKPVVAQDR
jgi:hypothetical protein